MTMAWRMALAAGLVMSSAAVAPPASADVPAGTDDELVLSVDGSSWAPDIGTALFGEDFVWVPGDVEAGTLYARNISGEAATATATVVLDAGADGSATALADELHVRTRLGSGPWTDGVRSADVVLGPQEVLPIDVEVAFDPAATNASMRQSVGLDVLVTLAGDVAGGGVDDPGAGAGPDAGQRGPGALPWTGANLVLPALVAAGLVILGFWLHRRSRHG